MNKLPDGALKSYLQNLINRVFKILPLKEEQCATLTSYLLSLRNELVGCYKISPILESKPQFTAVVCIIEYLATEEYDESVCKREVFKAIGLIESIMKEGCDGEF